LIIIPHLSSLLSEIEVVRAPSCWAITIVGEWKGAPNDKHLPVVDHIAGQRVVGFADSGSFPPFDPLK
jgi:hypothetical protein